MTARWRNSPSASSGFCNRPGFGLLTGEAGVGKTAALRLVTAQLNPHRYHALKSAGCAYTLLTDSGLELLRQASKGLPRHAGRILRTARRLAVPRALNHLPDDLLQAAIEEWR